MGAVFWLAGTLDSGRTDAGKFLYRKIKGKHSNTIFLDGDVLENVFDTESEGFPGEAQDFSGKEYSSYGMQCARLCAALQEQGMYVVCSTAPVPQSVSDWNRRNIGNYREICVGNPPSDWKEEIWQMCRNSGFAPKIC